MAKTTAEDPKSNQQIQAEHIAKELSEATGEPVGIAYSDGEPREIQYLYREGVVLVREEYLDQVMRLLQRYVDGVREQQGQQGEAPTPPEERDVLEPVVRGVRLLRVQGIDTMSALRLIRDGHEGFRIAGLGPGKVAPDHVMHISGDAGTCPAGEPEPAPPGSAVLPRPTTEPTAGEGVNVVVIDTGYDNDPAVKHFWLAGVTGDDDPMIRGARPNRTLAKYAGHGTFIAGVVRSVAPRAAVRVLTFFPNAGGTWESTLVQSLDLALEQEMPDVISMSAGTRAYTDGLLAFQTFYENRLRHHKGVVLVVAAGNDGERTYFWPAAAPYTVSVGALAADGRSRAHFSNFGGWVDVYAPGQDLVNAFPDGTYTYDERPNIPPDTAQPREELFRGMAIWSGTSFSTPIVAGLIAARMSRTGENGQDAAAALLASAREQAVPGVGAILLP